MNLISSYLFPEIPNYQLRKMALMKNILILTIVMIGLIHLSESNPAIGKKRSSGNICRSDDNLLSLFFYFYYYYFLRKTLLISNCNCLFYSCAITDLMGGYDFLGVCLRNCAQCKKMFGVYFEGQLCADNCVKFKGKIIPDCEDIGSIAPFLNKFE